MIDKYVEYLLGIIDFEEFIKHVDTVDSQELMNCMQEAQKRACLVRENRLLRELF